MSKIIAKVDVMEEVGTKDYETAFKAFLDEDRNIVGEDRVIEDSLVEAVENAIADFDGTKDDDYTFTLPDPYDKRALRTYAVTVTPLSEKQA